MAEEVEVSLLKEQAVKKAEVTKTDIADGGSTVIHTTGKDMSEQLKRLMGQHGQDAKINSLPPTPKEVQRTVVDTATKAARRARRNMGRLAPPIYK